MKQYNHELCRKIISNIYHLRYDLRKLEKREPSLFIAHEPEISSSCEFCTTDEILERVENEIIDALKISESIYFKEDMDRLVYGVKKMDIIVNEK